MKALLVFVAAIFLSAPSHASDLTKEQFFKLYLGVVEPDTIVSQWVQIYDALLPAAKTQARDALKQAVIDALTDIQTQRQTQWMDPIADHLTDANDTTLP